MKNQKHTCKCCNKKVKNVNNIHIENVNFSVSLCKKCNLELVTNLFLRIDDNIVLRADDKKGDFLIINVYEEQLKTDYWEDRKRINELLMMDNKPYDNGVNDNY